MLQRTLFDAGSSLPSPDANGIPRLAAAEATTRLRASGVPSATWTHIFMEHGSGNDRIGLRVPLQQLPNQIGVVDEFVHGEQSISNLECQTVERIQPDLR